MPTYEIEIPGSGKFRVESAGDLTDAQAFRYAQGQADAQKMADPTSGMSGGQKFLAGAGKAFVDVGRGVSQLLGGGQSADEVKEQRSLDAPLMKTGAGLAGNVVGNVAMTLPTLAIPGVNSYTGAAAVGAGMNALQPAENMRERGLNTAIGAGAGVAGQALGNALGRAVRPIQSSLSPEEQALAQSAGREGIPLTAGQKTGSRPLQIAESVMENLPLTSGTQLAQREAQQRAFTAAALRRAGIAGDTAAPQSLASQKSVLGSQMEGIAKNSTLDFNQGLTNDLAQIAGEAAKRGKTASEPVRELIDNILNEVGQNGSMAGQNYQAWRQMLRPLAKAGGPDGHLYGQIRSALDSSFDAQMGAAGSEAWKGANRQYANLKTIMQAAGGPGNAAAVDQLAPTQLSAALRQSLGKEGVALGKGDLNELTNIGTRFVKDQIPNSGTAQRQLIQGLLTGGGGAGVGAGAALATGHNPMEGAAYGAGVGAAGLITPKIAQMLLQNPAMESYLVNQASSPTAAMIAKALQAGGRGAGSALPAVYGMQE